MHANAEHWHDRCSRAHLSFFTLQRGGTVLEALRPLLGTRCNTRTYRSSRSSVGAPFWKLCVYCWVRGATRAPIVPHAPRGNAVLDALRPLLRARCDIELRRGASGNACQHGGLA
ncbi:hypothetical protein ALP54_03085 [Pseudomonas amygdali pv. lachrymans]|nr:hypothetical protein ALP54_03085 [Pseudomonas amygdali pv. lachrymans]